MNDFFILGELYAGIVLRGSRNISGPGGLDISRIALRLKSPDCDVSIIACLKVR